MCDSTFPCPDFEFLKNENVKTNINTSKVTERHSYAQSIAINDDICSSNFYFFLVMMMMIHALLHIHVYHSLCFFHHSILILALSQQHLFFCWDMAQALPHTQVYRAHSSQVCHLYPRLTVDRCFLHEVGHDIDIAYFTH